MKSVTRDQMGNLSYKKYIRYYIAKKNTCFHLNLHFRKALYKQDMTVPFARARAKLGGSIR